MNEVLPGRHVWALNDKASDPEAADYAFLCLDPDGKIIAWNAGARRTYGYTSEEIIGQPASCLYLDNDESGVDFAGRIEKDRCRGSSWN